MEITTTKIVGATIALGQRCATCFGRLDATGKCVWGCGSRAPKMRLAQKEMIKLCSGPWAPCYNCRALGHIANVKCKMCDGCGRIYDPAAKEIAP